MYGKEGNYGSQNDKIVPNPYSPKYQGKSLGTALRAMTTKGRFESAQRTSRQIGYSYRQKHELHKLSEWHSGQ